MTTRKGKPRHVIIELLRKPAEGRRKKTREAAGL